MSLAQLMTFDEDHKSTLPEKRRRVLEAIINYRGATLDHIVSATGMPLRTVSGRVAELCDEGKIYAMTLKRTSGRAVSSYYHEENLEKQMALARGRTRDKARKNLKALVNINLITKGLRKAIRYELDRI